MNFLMQLCLYQNIWIFKGICDIKSKYGAKQGILIIDLKKIFKLICNANQIILIISLIILYFYFICKPSMDSLSHKI